MLDGHFALRKPNEGPPPILCERLFGSGPKAHLNRDLQATRSEALKVVRNGNSELTAFLVGFCLIVGCQSGPKEPKGGWILAGYDADSGYSFRKDGVKYLAKCSYVKVDFQRVDGTTDRFYERLAPREDECTGVLPYMRKVVPFAEAGNGVLEMSTKEASDAVRTIQFTIVKASVPPPDTP
jgi:hypothetical protein